MLCNQTRNRIQDDAGPYWELNELMRDWYQVRKPACGCWPFAKRTPISVSGWLIVDNSRV